jgi:hypothetical protein
VIIPKFGGFVAKQTSANIDIDRNFVTPPSKHLLFNKHLIANDGLLVNELANKNKLTFQDSEVHISQFVDYMNNQLKTTKQFNLEKIGIFHLDSEGNINFQQDRYFNFLLNAYGLSAVQFVPSKQQNESEIELEKNTPIIPIERGKRNFWKYAAVACFLPIAFYSIWIPTKTSVLESGLISYKDFNPFYKQEVGSYKKNPLKLIKENKRATFEEKLTKEPNSNFAVFNLESDRFFTVCMEQENKSKPTSLESENIPKVSQINANQISSNSKKFEYVLGCFANPTNASNFFNKLQAAGFQVNRSSAGSLIRIGIGATNDLDSLQESIKKANDLGYQGWILKN